MITICSQTEIWIYTVVFFSNQEFILHKKTILLMKVLDKIRVNWKLKQHVTFRVDPFGPISLCLRLTNLSRFLTRVPILIISQNTSSSNTLAAWHGKQRIRSLKFTVIAFSLHSKLFSKAFYVQTINF